MKPRMVLLIFVISAVLVNPFLYSTNTVAQSPPGAKPICTLVLDPPLSKVNSGDIVTFTGRLSTNGSGVSGQTVLIKDDDPGGIDNILGSQLTGSNGEFVITWTARRTDPRDNTVEVYAVFRGYPDYVGSITSQYVITVAEEVTEEAHPPGIAVIKNLEKTTLILVKNAGDTSIGSIQIKVNDGSVSFVKAKYWDRKRISNNEVVLTSSNGLEPNQAVLVIMKWKDRPDLPKEMKQPLAHCIVISPDITAIEGRIHDGCIAIILFLEP